MKTKLAILISGRGSNMEAIAREIQDGMLKNHCELVVVASNKPSAHGLETARHMGIPVCCITSKNKTREDFESELIATLANYKPDYIVLAGFMRILTKTFLDTYKNRVINIHPADTEAYQGPSGYEWAFNNQLKTTYITVHLVDEGVDTGKVIAKQEVDISRCTTLEAVKKAGIQEEHTFYSKALIQYFTNQPNPQLNSKCAVSSV